MANKRLNAKQAARIRYEIKAGKNVSAARRSALDEYERELAAQQAQQSGAGDGSPEGGTDNPAPAPKVDPVSSHESGSVPPADTLPDLGAPIPGVDPPPRVAAAPIASGSSAAGGAGKTGDWRDKWRAQVHFTGDGRQMLCEGIGMSIVEGLAALRDETAKVVSPKTPDPRQLAGLFVLAMDDLLPERAKLTPKIGAALLTVGTIGERYYHADKIKEFLKTDPEHQAWLRKQAERERNEQELRAKAEAERAAASSPPPAAADAPTRPEAPPAPEPPPVNGTAVVRGAVPRNVAPPIDLTSADAIY